MINYKNEVYN